MKGIVTDLTYFWIRLFKLYPNTDTAKPGLWVALGFTRTRISKDKLGSEYGSYLFSIYQNSPFIFFYDIKANMLNSSILYYHFGKLLLQEVFNFRMISNLDFQTGSDRILKTRSGPIHLLKPISASGSAKHGP